MSDLVTNGRLPVKVKAGDLIVEEQNGLVTLPFESIVEFKYGNPQDLPALVTRLENAATQTSGIISTTIAQIRAMTTAPSQGVQYWITDKGQERIFLYDPTDNSSLDDTALTLVATGGYRFKCLLGDEVRLSWFGVKQGDEISQIFLSCSQLLNSKGLQGKWITLDAGSYKWANYIRAEYPGKLRCEGGKAILTATNNNNILWFTGLWYVKNIIFNGYLGTPVLNSSGTISQNPDDYTPYALVRLSSPSNFDGCDWSNSRGHGLYAEGNINVDLPELPNGSNSSCSHITDFQFLGNRGAGFYAESPNNTYGYDNNEIYLFNGGPAGFANNGWGYIDESFLGCRVSNVQFNNNTFGHSRVSTTHGNGKGSMTGIYEEETNQDHPSIWGANTIVEGRLNMPNPSIQVLGNAVVRNGRNVTGLSTPSLNIQYGSNGITFQGPGNAGVINASYLYTPEQTRLVYVAGGETRYFSELFQNGVDLTQQGSGYHRKSINAGWAFYNTYVGPRYLTELFFTDRDDPDAQSILWTVGDKLRPLNYLAAKPEYYVCETPGPLNGGTQYPGVTAYINPNNGGQPTFNDVTSIHVGDYIQINGGTFKVLSINTTTKLVSVDGYVNGANQTFPVYTAKGVLRAVGDMRGSTSQRVNLKPEDAGIRYYDTDTHIEYRWTGTEYQQI